VSTVEAEERLSEMRSNMRMGVRCNLIIALLQHVGLYSCAQTVSPVIAEYKTVAEGRIALTNNTFARLAVVLEPRSFGVTPDGIGVYRPLDPTIHVELSSKSVRIDPGQSYYVFYKAKADALPAWFTIYAAFSPARPTTGLNVRIFLPHTVYIYPTKPKSKSDAVEVTHAGYSREAGKIVCEIVNNTIDLERVAEIRVISGSHSSTSPGFPLLPGTKRHVEMDWRELDPPQELVVHTHRTTVRSRLRMNSSADPDNSAQ
jgi:hypothetical protein